MRRRLRGGAAADNGFVNRRPRGSRPGNLFRIREQLVNQRTELVNALRAHLYEFGYVAPQGVGF